MIHVITSGFFNPVGEHHIVYIDSAYELGESLAFPLEKVKLTIIVNNNQQVKLKGSCPFQDTYERWTIISKMYPWADVLTSSSQTKDVSSDIKRIYDCYQSKHFLLRPRKIIFCNGGDRQPINADNSEILTCAELGIQTFFGVGGKDKLGSSSETIKRAVRWYNDKMG